MTVRVNQRCDDVILQAWNTFKRQNCYILIQQTDQVWSNELEWPQSKISRSFVLANLTVILKGDHAL